MKERSGENKKVFLLIDADSILWSACTCRKGSEDDTHGDQMIHDLDMAEHKFEEVLFSHINNLTENFNFTSIGYILFIEGEGNFRYDIDPLYKIKRKEKPEPVLLQKVKNFAIRTQPCFLSHNVETDDSVISTYLLYKDQVNIVILSMDKDIKTFPVVVYDYYHNKRELLVISEEQARKNFWMQMLVGDTADSIIGVSGIGEVKANKILKECKSEFSFMRTVYKTYIKKYRCKGKRLFLKNYGLLKLRTTNIKTPNLHEYI